MAKGTLLFAKDTATKQPFSIRGYLMLCCGTANTAAAPGLPLIQNKTANALLKAYITSAPVSSSFHIQPYSFLRNRIKSSLWPNLL